MVTSLTDTLDTGLMSVTVIEDGQETPTPENLSALDSLIVNRFGWAFRFGMGASNSLNDYRYGYIVPGITLNPDTISRLEERLQEETPLTNPTVLMKAQTNVSDDELARMEQLGQLPHEALSALQEFRDEMDDK